MQFNSRFDLAGSLVVLGLLAGVAPASADFDGPRLRGSYGFTGSAECLVAPGHVGDLMIAVTLFGGVVGLIYLLGRMLSYGQAPNTTRPRSLLARVMRVERRRLSRGGPLPYASAIAAGSHAGFKVP